MLVRGGRGKREKGMEPPLPPLPHSHLPTLVRSPLLIHTPRAHSYPRARSYHPQSFVTPMVVHTPHGRSHPLRSPCARSYPRTRSSSSPLFCIRRPSLTFASLPWPPGPRHWCCHATVVVAATVAVAAAAVRTCALPLTGPLVRVCPPCACPLFYLW